MPPKIVYLSPRHTRPWLAVKYGVALAEADASVEIFATSENIEQFDHGIIKVDVPFKIFPPSWYLPLVWRFDALAHLRSPLPSLQMAQALLRARADIYIAGQPDDLKIAAMAARVHNARLVYMPFEYYPDLSYGDRATMERYARYEARYAPRVSMWISLGDKYSDIYRSNYNLNGRVTTIYSSVPRHVDCTPQGLRSRIGATVDTIILLYTGQVTRARGLWDVLEALPLVPDKVHFVVIGPMDTATLRSDAARAGLAHRVHVLDMVPQDELMGYTAEADIGIIPIHDVCTSYRYCNPGKLFEYMGAGLPLIVRASLEQLNWYVTSRGLGEVFESGSPQSLAAAIRQLAEDGVYRRRCAENVRRIHETEACWEIQAERLRRAVLGFA